MKGKLFNTNDNLLKYSTVEFEDGIVELDTILTFARKLDPVESDFNPNLLGWWYWANNGCWSCL